MMSGFRLEIPRVELTRILYIFTASVGVTGIIRSAIPLPCSLKFGVAKFKMVAGQNGRNFFLSATLFVQGTVGDF